MTHIKPVTVQSFPNTVVADHAQVSVDLGVLPASSCSGSVVLGTVNAEGNFVAATGSTTVEMTTEQYAAWGTDDEYAVNCLLANLGLVKA